MRAGRDYERSTHARGPRGRACYAREDAAAAFRIRIASEPRFGSHWSGCGASSPSRASRISQRDARRCRPGSRPCSSTPAPGIPNSRRGCACAQPGRRSTDLVAGLFPVNLLAEVHVLDQSFEQEGDPASAALRWPSLSRCSSASPERCSPPWRSPRPPRSPAPPPRRRHRWRSDYNRASNSLFSVFKFLSLRRGAGAGRRRASIEATIPSDDGHAARLVGSPWSRAQAAQRAWRARQAPPTARSGAWGIGPPAPPRLGWVTSGRLSTVKVPAAGRRIEVCCPVCCCCDTPSTVPRSSVSKRAVARRRAPRGGALAGKKA